MRQKRNYIGLSCSLHDNAIAIVNSEGELVFAEASERYLQNKRALCSPPDDLIRAGELLEQYCEPDAELVVVKSWSDGAPAIFAREDAHAASLLRTAERIGGLEEIVFGLLDYRHTLQMAGHAITGAGRGISYHCKRGGTRPAHTVHRAYDHHKTHAAYACLSSPFEAATCAIVDGFGEGVSTAIYAFEKGRIRELTPRPSDLGAMTRSLGVFYMDLCSWCGLEKWKGEEWKVMGLAAYGKRDERLYELFRGLLDVEGAQFSRPASATAAVAELAKRRRPRGAPLRDWADMAYTGQLVFCELFGKLLRNVREIAPSDNLVLGGGCALNAAWNGEVLGKTGFKRLHVPSAPADDGNAVGAALLAYTEDHPDAAAHASWSSPYLGSCASEHALAHLVRLGGVSKLSVCPGKIHERAADLLAEGKMIAWMQGRAEFGPRALGNRSILADPRPKDMKDRINAKVKFREEYRPFAPSILHDFGEQYFVDYQWTPNMERALRFRDGVGDLVPAVVHQDGTGRLQSVTEQSNPLFHGLIRAFHQRTGVPLLLNTSFNVMGKPIVHSVEDALGVFFTCGLDALVIGDVLIEKSS
jgi:carbamoyltransferase